MGDEHDDPIADWLLQHLDEVYDDRDAPFDVLWHLWKEEPPENSKDFEVCAEQLEQHAPLVVSLDEDEHEPPEKTWQKMYADVQKVPERCQAMEVRSMILKQMKSIGATTWQERLQEDARAGVFAFDVHATSPDQGIVDFGLLYSHLYILLVATDQGADQVAAGALVEKEIRNNIFVWKFHQWCLQHALHLIVKRQFEKLKLSSG
eukprot:3356791-Karenia_brevis.AAC.1